MWPKRSACALKMRVTVSGLPTTSVPAALGLIEIGCDRDGGKVPRTFREIIEPDAMGLAGDALGLGIGVGDEDGAHHAHERRGYRRAEGLSFVGMEDPLLPEILHDVADVVIRAERHAVHRAWPRTPGHVRPAAHTRTADAVAA